MKTMIWKELRENARWALLAGFGLLLAEIYALSMGKANIANGIFAVSLCGNNFLLVSAFGCCAVGAILGALQILPELRRDQWASLLHRPISREKILAGKMLAGSLLYLAATGIPLAASILYVIWPGVYPAPFVPGLVLPAASDLLLGLAFYVCALLVGLHPGRWWGTRGVIVLAAVGMLMTHLESGWEFVPPVAALAVFFVAAWGAMRNPLGRSAWLSRLAFGVTMLAGVEAVLVVLGVGLRTARNEEIYGFYYSNFFIATDGAVFLQRSDDKGGFQLTDMEGKPITDERYVGNSANNFSLYPMDLADRNSPRGRHLWGLRRSSENQVEMFEGQYNTPELWYRVEGKKSYFVGYDILSKRPVGFFDQEGFKRPGELRQPFASEPQGSPLQQLNPYLYWMGPQVLMFDFMDRKMTPLVNVGSEQIYGVDKFPNGAEHPRIAVALASEIRIYDMNGMLQFSIPYGYPAERWPDVGITATDDFSRIFVRYSNYRTREDIPVHLDAIDGQGQRVATYQSSHQDSIQLPTSWGNRVADLLSPPVPAVLLSTWNAHRPVNLQADFATGIPTALIGQFERVRTRSELAILGGWTLVLCGIAVAWARKGGLSTAQIVRWVVLTAVFGVAGLLAYRLVTDWPVQVRCPRCARRRPIGLGTCPNCQAPWDVPAVNGTEIFEAA